MPGEPPEHAGLQQGLQRNPQALRHSNQPITTFRAPVPVATIFIICHASLTDGFFF